MSSVAYKIGSDPELFVRNKFTKDFVSAHTFLPGTKSNPFPVECGAIQVDGMAAEFNINPAETEQEFIKNIDVVVAQVKEYVHKHDPELELVFEPFAEFNPIYFAIQPLEPKILGCDPDYDEFGTEKIPPEGFQDQPWRTAAGHIHIGWTNGQDPYEFNHFEKCKRFAREFKTVDGFAPKTSEELRRTRYYGKPGSFRPKSYGVELRSPSNRWVATPDGRSKMYRNIQKKLGEMRT